MVVGLISGKSYSLEGGLHTDVLCISAIGNTALLKTYLKDKEEYIVATKTQITSDKKLYWDSAKFYNDLSIAARKFEAATSDYLQDMNNLKDLLREEVSSGDGKYARVIISLENDFNSKITEEEADKLDRIYDEYIDNDDLYLLNEILSDYYNEPELMEDEEEEDEEYE